MIIFHHGSALIDIFEASSGFPVDMVMLLPASCKVLKIRCQQNIVITYHLDKPLNFTWEKSRPLLRRHGKSPVPHMSIVATEAWKWCLVDANQLHFTMWIWFITDQPCQASIIHVASMLNEIETIDAKSRAQKEHQKKAMVTVKKIPSSTVCCCIGIFFECIWINTHFKMSLYKCAFPLLQ